MSKRKYCYVIANKENGDLLVENAKLPFYWIKSVAKERQKAFSDKYGVFKIELKDIEKLVLGSKPA